MPQPTSGTSRPRIAIYSHDTMGLGHVRRNLLIATALASGELAADVLLVSGACEAQSFRLPSGVDLLTLPAVEKTAAGVYEARRLHTGFEELVELRSRIIESAFKGFAPDLLLVDNVPQGVGGELEPGVRYLRRNGARLVLGLRDITDAPEAVRREWDREQTAEFIRNFYECIWIYGDPAIYDRIVEDGMSADLADRSRFVGYLDQRLSVDEPSGLEAEQISRVAASGRPLVLCLIGGGQDGDLLASAFAEVPFAPGHTGVIVAGPFLDSGARRRLTQRAAGREDLFVIDFLADPRPLVARAERVVAMGGYNTIGEILSFEKPALIVPRVRPRREQSLRAERLRELGLLDECISPDDLSPATLRRWVERPLVERCLRERIDLGALSRLSGLAAGLLASRPSRPMALSGRDSPRERGAVR